MAILQIIDQLDALVENSRRVPMSALRMIDYGQTKQAIERLRVNVPSSIMESERMLQERDRILEAAEAEATRIIEHAKRHANDILSNDSLVAAARQEPSESSSTRSRRPRFAATKPIAMPRVSSRNWPRNCASSASR